MEPRLVVVEHEIDCTLDRFEPWLRSAGCELEVRRPYAGEPVGDLGGAAGLVVLGGSMGALDDEVAPWLPAVRRLLAEAVETQLPTLGICLGAQLLAVAAGGRVVRGAAGTEAGLVSVSWTEAARADPLVAGLPEPMLTPSLHDDEIVELPAGAVLLGGTATYPHHVFRVGTCAWGVQFHPELSPDWYDAWAGSIPTLDAAGTGAALRAADADVLAGGAALARRFAAVAGRVA